MANALPHGLVKGYGAEALTLDKMTPTKQGYITGFGGLYK